MTINIMSRLEQALRIALAEHVFTEDELSRNRVIENIRRAVCDDDRHDQNDDDDYQGTLADFKNLLNPVVTDKDGQPALNEIWTDPNFLFPVIAASAQLYDRMIDPNNDSALTVHVTPSSESLVGYRLTGLTATGKKVDQETGLWLETNLEKHDLLRISTMLSAAAQFVMIQPDALTAGANYLCTEASKTASSPMNTGSDTRTAKSHTQENVSLGAGSYIIVDA